MTQNADPEKDVHILLENLEIAATCGVCCRLSPSVLGGDPCPHSHVVELVPDR